MTSSDVDILLISLNTQLTEEFGENINITHHVDFTNHLIETIIQLSTELGLDLKEFLDATIFPFMVNLDIEGLSIISNIDVLLNGEAFDSKPTDDQFKNLLGDIFAGGHIDGGSLPDVIDLWHVIVIQPELCCPFQTKIPWSSDLLNPFSSQYLMTAIDVAKLLMTGD